MLISVCTAQIGSTPQVEYRLLLGSVLETATGRSMATLFSAMPIPSERLHSSM
jgi:hypothetical protein